MSALDPVLSVRDLRVWYGSPRGAVRAVVRAGVVASMVGHCIRDILKATVVALQVFT